MVLSALSHSSFSYLLEIIFSLNIDVYIFWSIYKDVGDIMPFESSILVYIC